MDYPGEPQIDWLDRMLLQSREMVWQGRQGQTESEAREKRAGYEL